MSEFKKGDRVRIVREFESPQLKSVYDGMTGTIEAIFPTCTYKYFVRLDEGGYATVFFEVEHLKKYPVIVITTDGVTTTATKRLGKKVLGTAYSKCAPCDIFDSDFGAILALSRLCDIPVNFVQEETPQPPKKYTHKVVCVESTEKWWTVGKIYKCEDGLLQDDSGMIRNRSAGGYPGNIKDLNDLWWDCDSREARFIELVED